MAGLSLLIEDGGLIVEADRDPPADLIAALRRHKVELIAALLPPGGAPSSPAGTQGAGEIEERAAIIEAAPASAAMG